MAVKYTIVPHGNQENPEAPKKFYAQAKSSGELTLRKLSKEKAEGSTTVSDTDVLAVLNDLARILRRHLDNGKIVRLGNSSSFQIAITNEGAETVEKFNTPLIKDGKVTFRQGIDLKE